MFPHVAIDQLDACVWTRREKSLSCAKFRQSKTRWWWHCWCMPQERYWVGMQRSRYCGTFWPLHHKRCMVGREGVCPLYLDLRYDGYWHCMIVIDILCFPTQALRASDAGLVDGRGECTNTSSLFVTHVVTDESSSTGVAPPVVRLQSVNGDSAWLRIASDTGLLGITDDVDARATLLQLVSVGNDTHVLLAAGCGTQLSTPDCQDGQFTIYARSWMSH